MFMNPLMMPDDGYYPTGTWDQGGYGSTGVIYEGSTPQTMINEWVNGETFPTGLKNALVARSFKMSYFDNDITVWPITGNALENNVQLHASRFTDNQTMAPLTLTDIVDYCGVGTDLTGQQIVDMLGINYSENYPVQLMSATDNNYLFYVNKTTGAITTNSNTASAIYPVAYIDLNFLTTRTDNVGWIMGPRKTNQKYILNYDVYSTEDEGTNIALDLSGSSAGSLLVNSTETNTITNLTTQLTDNRVKIEFYAYTNMGKSLQINGTNYLINADETSDVILEFVNTNINIEFVNNTDTGSSQTYQRHFVLYFTQTYDYIAANYPELLIE